MEKVVAALLVPRSDFIVPIKDIITRLEAQRKPHLLATVVALHKVKAPQRMLTIYFPAIFALGHVVRECTWACRIIGTGYRAHQVLLEAVLVMIGLCGPDAKKVEYIRTTTIALLAWRQWHNQVPGYVHVEESGEALLERLGHQLHLHPQAISIDDRLDLYVTLPGPKDVRDIRGAVSQSLVTMFRRSIRIFFEKASKPDASFVQYKAKVATAQPDAV